MPDKLYKPPYQFSVTIGETCTRKLVTFSDLAEKLKMPVEDLMRQCNGKTAHPKNRSVRVEGDGESIAPGSELSVSGWNHPLPVSLD
jgi:hypothetical protein